MKILFSYEIDYFFPWTVNFYCFSWQIHGFQVGILESYPSPSAYCYFSEYWGSPKDAQQFFQNEIVENLKSQQITLLSWWGEERGKIRFSNFQVSFNNVNNSKKKKCNVTLTYGYDTCYKYFFGRTCEKTITILYSYFEILKYEF